MTMDRTTGLSLRQLRAHDQAELALQASQRDLEAFVLKRLAHKRAIIKNILAKTRSNAYSYSQPASGHWATQVGRLKLLSLTEKTITVEVVPHHQPYSNQAPRRRIHTIPRALIHSSDWQFAKEYRQALYAARTGAQREELARLKEQEAALRREAANAQARLNANLKEQALIEKSLKKGGQR